MTPPLTKASGTLKDSLAATVIAVTAIASTPASAGSFTLSLTPRGDSAEMVRTGLEIYGLVNDLKGKNHAKVDQKGRNNAAAVSQKSEGNYALVYQRGRGHEATLRPAATTPTASSSSAKPRISMSPNSAEAMSVSSSRVAARTRLKPAARSSSRWCGTDRDRRWGKVGRTPASRCTRAPSASPRAGRDGART